VIPATSRAFLSVIETRSLLYLEAFNSFLVLMKTWEKIALIGAGTAGVAAGALILLDHHGYEKIFPVELNDVVLDVGAGGTWYSDILGIYTEEFTVSAAKKVGQGGLVISVEPSPKNAVALEKKVARAGLNNVIIVQKAAWNYKTRLPFYITAAPTGHTLISKPAIETVTVEADTLDNIVSDLGIGRVDFIKMDIEGAEIEALTGAERVLGMARKVVIAAYHDNRPDISPTHPWVNEFLQARGFQTQITHPGLVHGWR